MATSAVREKYCTSAGRLDLSTIYFITYQSQNMDLPIPLAHHQLQAIPKFFGNTYVCVALVAEFGIIVRLTVLTQRAASIAVTCANVRQVCAGAVILIR